MTVAGEGDEIGASRASSPKALTVNRLSSMPGELEVGRRGRCPSAARRDRSAFGDPVEAPQQLHAGQREGSADDARPQLAEVTSFKNPLLFRRDVVLGSRRLGENGRVQLAVELHAVEAEALQHAPPADAIASPGPAAIEQRPVDVEKKKPPFMLRTRV